MGNRVRGLFFPKEYGTVGNYKGKKKKQTVPLEHKGLNNKFVCPQKGRLLKYLCVPLECSLRTPQSLSGLP